LVKAGFEALAARGEDGSLALHAAFSSKWFTKGRPDVLEAVNFLVKECPAALKVKDKTGKTPVMAAISEGTEASPMTA
jgi:hypothetical protein